jgi:hypothetical protein
MIPERGKRTVAYRVACWWLDSPRVDRIRQYVIRKEREHNRHAKLRINGVPAARFIKRAYDLGDDLNGPGRFDMTDATQGELRRIRDWITMAEQDALDARKTPR